MNISYFDIKTEPQENGIWGTPFHLRRIDKVVWCNEKLYSAIIMGIAEKYDAPFIISRSTDEGFLVESLEKIFNGHRLTYIRFENYYLEGNRLYYIKNEKERRYLKLKKVEKD